jgi:HEAT repeat protein
LGQGTPEQSTARTIQKLRDEDNSLIPSDTIKRLEDIGTPAIPALIEALSDKDVALRHGAAKALSFFGPAAAPAVTALTRALDDQDVLVREWAAQSLAEIGPDAKTAVPKLTEKLKDQEGQFPLRAVDALGKIGPAAKDSIPALIELLQNKTDGWDWPVIEALGEIGPDAKAAVPLLIEALEEDEDHKVGTVVHKSSIEALGRIGPEAKAAVPAIVRRSLSYWGYVELADEAMARIGPAAVPALVELLSGHNKDLGASAARYLGKLGPNAKSALPILFGAMKDDDYGLSSAAVAAVEAIEPDEKPDIPVLIGLLKVRNSKTHDYAVMVLGKMGTPAVPALIGALGDENASVRSDAARTLAGMRSEARDAAPALIKSVTDEDGSVRFYAACALGNIGMDAKTAVPALIEVLNYKSDHYTANVKAADILKQFGAEAASALPSLIESLQSDNWDVERAAAEALGTIVLKAETVPPTVVADAQIGLQKAKADMADRTDVANVKAAVDSALQNVQERKEADARGGREARIAGKEANLAEAKCKYLMVQITGQLNGIPRVGTGILFGYQADRLYVLTARHLVYGEFATTISNATIKIGFLPGETLPAELLSNSDKDTDLAVLLVRNVKEHGIPVELLPFDRVGDPKLLKSGDKVFALGLPMESDATPTPPGEFIKAVGDRLLFQSKEVREGYSGGGLFNSNWELIGMIRADDPNKSEAVSLDRIMGELTDWGYPLNLSIPDQGGR